MLASGCRYYCNNNICCLRILVRGIQNLFHFSRLITPIQRPSTVRSQYNGSENWVIVDYPFSDVVTLCCRWKFARRVSWRIASPQVRTDNEYPIGYRWPCGGRPPHVQNNKAVDTIALPDISFADPVQLQTTATMSTALFMQVLRVHPVRLCSFSHVLCTLSFRPPHLIYDKPFQPNPVHISGSSYHSHMSNRLCRYTILSRLHAYQLIKRPSSHGYWLPESMPTSQSADTI